MNKLRIPELIFVLSLLFFPFEIVLAEEMVTSELIEELLLAEMRFINTKNIEGYMALFDKSCIHINPKGDKEDWDEIRLMVYKSFIAATHVLHKTEVQSMVISEDKKSAQVILHNKTKFLLERGRDKFVINKFSESEAMFVLVDGDLKYKSTRFIRDLQ